jgi:glycolate oxidase iron-sulfur subunit
MAEVKELARMLMELDDQMATCMKCGMCQAVCPVFAETLREADVTRGKIALLENLAHEIVKDPKGVQEKLNKCLLCGSCAAGCPSGVKIMDIFLNARMIINGYMGLSPAKRFVLHSMLAKPKLFNALMGMAGKFQGLVTRPANAAMGTSCAPVFSSMIGDRHFTPLAKTSLHSAVGTVNTAAGQSGIKVAFFPGCMADKMYTQVGHAALKVFAHHGVGVYLPDAQACCGIPSLASGDKESYEALVRYNADILSRENYDYLVTPCGTCTETIRNIWPLLMDGYPDDLKERIRSISGRTMDINAFLVDVIGVKAVESASDAHTVTIHDSCHLKKSLGVSAQLRTLVRANPHYKVVEMNEADRCCGCGGSFTLYHYDLSKRIGRRKRDNIAASGAEMVATGCPACMMQIYDMLSQAGDRNPVKHPIEIYAETLP